MEQAELVALIAGGVPRERGVWADLGAGGGAFTAALRTLLPADATIYAVDRDGGAVRQVQALATQPGALIQPVQADFSQPLTLPPLDGLLRANALHFVRPQPRVLTQLAQYLRPGGRLLVVEYDLALPRPWVPFPISADAFPALAAAAGLIAASSAHVVHHATAACCTPAWR